MVMADEATHVCFIKKRGITSVKKKKRKYNTKRKK